MLDKFLTVRDANRAERALRKLLRHDVTRWVLTGGFATEIHHQLCGLECHVRPLTDIDFIATGFDHLPDTLSHDYLFRHVHPFDPPGKTILQAIDTEEVLRIDVFRACGGTADRTSEVRLFNTTIPIISPEDLASRLARLSLDLAGNIPVPAKYPRDFLRLMRFVDSKVIETAWQEHRKPNFPPTFKEAGALLQTLIPARQHLLISPTYSTDVTEICSRCSPTAVFQLTVPDQILSVLGYC